MSLWPNISSLPSQRTMRDKGRYVDVLPIAYPRMDQGGVVLKWVSDKDATQEFCYFLKSSEGKAILKRFGFGIPNE